MTFGTLLGSGLICMYYFLPIWPLNQKPWKTTLPSGWKEGSAFIFIPALGVSDKGKVWIGGFSNYLTCDTSIIGQFTLNSQSEIQ